MQDQFMQQRKGGFQGLAVSRVPKFAVPWLDS